MTARVSARVRSFSAAKVGVSVQEQNAEIARPLGVAGVVSTTAHPLGTFEGRLSCRNISAGLQQRAERGDGLWLSAGFGSLVRRHGAARMSTAFEDQSKVIRPIRIGATIG